MASSLDSPVRESALEHRALGELDLQHDGLQTAFLGELLDGLAADCRAAAAPPRRSRRSAPASQPASRQRAASSITRSSTNSPIGTMRPVSSAMPMKRAGATKPCGRMFPAHQRLERHHAVGFDVDDRLVVHVELLLLERRAQARLDGHAFLQLAVHDGLKSWKLLRPRSLAWYIAVSDWRSSSPRSCRRADTGSRRCWRWSRAAAVDDDRRAQRFVDARGGLVDLVACS